jgi:hypothetical protein
MMNINFGSSRRWSSRVLRVKGGKQEGEMEERSKSMKSSSRVSFVPQEDKMQ